MPEGESPVVPTAPDVGAELTHIREDIASMRRELAERVAEGLKPAAAVVVEPPAPVAAIPPAPVPNVAHKKGLGKRLSRFL